MQQWPFLPTLIQIFKLAQWFGIPSYGNIVTLLYAVIVFLMLVAIEGVAIWKIIRFFAGMNLDKDNERGLISRLSGVIFYGNGLLSFILSWKFISSWKRISFFWMRAETADGLDMPIDKKIQLKIIITSCFVGFCAVAEHLLSMVSAIGLNGLPFEYIFKTYILNSHGMFIRPEEYTLWAAIPIFIVSKIATILWNFQDLIIILISMGLSSRYHRLNSYVNVVVTYEWKTRGRMKFGTDKYISSLLWRRIREAYVRQASLVRMIDGHIGALMLLSNINNFYFICLQLFLGLNTSQGSLINYIYYFLSLGWLLFRACSVVLVASDINVHSQRALTYLSICPAAAYNVEVKRLKNQLTNDFVALSGMKFFWLCRETLLEVAGNIIKYELVLIQYDK